MKSATLRPLLAVLSLPRSRCGSAACLDRLKEHLAHHRRPGKDTTTMACASSGRASFYWRRWRGCDHPHHLPFSASLQEMVVGRGGGRTGMYEETERHSGD